MTLCNLSSHLNDDLVCIGWAVLLYWRSPYPSPVLAPWSTSSFCSTACSRLATSCMMELAGWHLGWQAAYSTIPTERVVCLCLLHHALTSTSYTTSKRTGQVGWTEIILILHTRETDFAILTHRCTQFPKKRVGPQAWQCLSQGLSLAAPVPLPPQNTEQNAHQIIKPTWVPVKLSSNESPLQQLIRSSDNGHANTIRWTGVVTVLLWPG